MTTFREAVLGSSPAWLRQSLSGGWMGVVWGLMADGVAHGQTIGARMGMIRDSASTEDVLGFFGEERGLPRYPVETEEGYRDRLHGAWDAYDIAGSDGGMIAQLEAAGYTGAQIYTARDDWAVGDPDWSRYWVVIPAGTHSVTGPGANWGAGRAWGDGLLWGISTGEADVATVRQIVRKWNPVRWRCVEIIFVVSGTIWGGGGAWGTAPLGSGDTWGGSVVKVGV